MDKQVFLNEVKINFNLRTTKSNKPTNIYLLIRLNGKQHKFSTGVKVYPEQWNKDKQEAYISYRLTELDNQNNIVVNSKIKELKTSFTEYKQYLCGNPNQLSNAVIILKKYIYKDMEKKATNPIAWLIRAILDDKILKESAKNAYRGQIRLFSAFLKETGRQNITFDDINLSLLKTYENYILNHYCPKKFSHKFS